MGRYSEYCYIQSIAEKLKDKWRLGLEKNFIQHGTVSVLDHSIRVANISLMIADRFRMKVNRASLIRGVLLHDYFLYDWHKKGEGHRLHGFRHPFSAVRKAKEDYIITKKEEGIIRSHMFPLVPVPPTSKEGWIVCLADKISAFNETFFHRKKDQKTI